MPMPATISWSHEAMTTDARRVLHSLSLFVGGSTLAAAEAVRATDSALVVDELAALVEHHLVQRSETSGDSRLAMFETVREFAADELTLTGDAPTTRRPTPIMPFTSPRAPTRPRRVSPRSTKRRATTGSRSSMTTSVLRCNGRSTSTRQRAALGVSEALLDRVGIARACRHIGNADIGRGQYAAAIGWYTHSRDLGVELGETELIGGAVSNLGSVAYFQGDLVHAERCWSETATIFRDRHDNNRLATALNNLAELETLRGNRTSPSPVTRRCSSYAGSYATRSVSPGS